MAHTPDHAKRLMRELAPLLPEGAEVVLDRQKYCDPGFVELFFETVEDLIFRDPQAGLAIADVARRLAHSMPEGADRKGRQQNCERLVRAYGLLGSAQRATGHLHQAEEAYRVAATYCGKAGLSAVGNPTEVSRTCCGELSLRWAFLRAYQKKYDDALRFVERAIQLFESENERQWIGCALATRGAVFLFADRYSEAVAVLSEALGSYKLTARVESSASANLAHAVSQTDDPEGLVKAQVQLRRARKLAGPRRSVEKSVFYWIEGRIYVRRGSTERAERCYKKALQGFVKFQTPYEIALVGLDLSSLYRFSKRWSELELLTADIYRRFRELHEDTEALAALKLWLDGAQARSLTIDRISEFKSQLAELKLRHPSPRAAEPIA